MRVRRAATRARLRSGVQQEVSSTASGFGGVRCRGEGVIGIHRGRAAAGLIFDFRVGVQVGAAVDDLDMLETGGEQAAAVVVDANGSGDAANVGGDAVGDGLGQFVLESDIADGETAAGLEDAGDFAEDGGLVGREIENAVGDDAIDGGIGQRNLVDGGEVELDIGVAAGVGVGAGALDHGGRHIDADGAAGGADHVWTRGRHRDRRRSRDRRRLRRV